MAIIFTAYTGIYLCTAVDPHDELLEAAQTTAHAANARLNDPVAADAVAGLDAFYDVLENKSDEDNPRSDEGCEGDGAELQKAELKGATERATHAAARTIACEVPLNDDGGDIVL